MRNTKNQNIKVEIIKEMLKRKIYYLLYSSNDRDTRLLAFANTLSSTTHLRKRSVAGKSDKAQQRLHKIKKQCRKL